MAYISRFFKFLDLFSIPIELNYNRNHKYKSIFGGLVSIFVYTAAFYFLTKQYISWSNINVSTTITSSEIFSVPSLLNANQSVEYTFDHKNYGAYFAMWAKLPNGTDLIYTDLQSYFTIEYKYSFTGLVLDQKNLDFENCNTREMNDYFYIDYDEKTVPINETLPWSICIKDPLKMGLFADPENSMIYEPKIYMQIKQCINSSANNNSCANIEEIREMKKYVIVQASLPSTIYDFKNQTNSIKRFVKGDYYSLDLGLQKIISIELNPTFLYKDWGLFNDDYILDSINFNPGKQSLDFTTKDENDNLLLEYQIALSYQTDKYYIRNQKLDDIIGSVGGMISVLYSLGSFFCIRTNSLLLMNSLINSTFRFNVNSKKKRQTKSTK